MARFANITEKDLEAINFEKDSKNTKKLNTTLFNILVSYAQEKKKMVDFASISKQEMNELLRTFYVEVRKADGSKYKKNSFRAIRSSIQRKMKELRGNDFDIIKDEEFASSNLHFNAEAVSLKKEGLGDTVHHKPISKEDLDILYNTSNTFSVENPVGLQRKVFFEIMMHFCRRDTKNLRELQVSDFLIKNNTGVEMVVIVTDETTNHHDEDDTEEEQMVMAATGGKNCPVASFKLYVSKLSPKVTAFFQRPKKTYDLSKQPWYENMPLGEKTLTSMMKTISVEAQLSEKYTNHCIRATALSILDQNNAEPQHPILMSGHLSESSIRSYCKTNETRKREMSDVLSSNTSGIKEKSSKKAYSSDNHSQPPEGSPIFHITLPKNNDESGSSSSALSNLPGGFTFNNCQVHFHV